MGTVLQYTLVYCSEKDMRKAVCIAIQTGCAGRGAGQARSAGCWRTTQADARGARSSRREASTAGRRGACGLGVLLGQQAVHLVDSACF